MVRQWHCTLLCCVLLCFVLCTLFIFNRLIILPSLYLTQLNTFKSRNSCQWLCIKCVSQWFCVHSLSLYVFVHCFKVSFLNYVTLYVWPFQMLHGCSPFLWFCKIENRWDFQFFLRRIQHFKWLLLFLQIWNHISAYVCTTRQSTLHAMVKWFLIGEQF